MHDKLIEILQGSQGSLRVAIPSPRQGELEPRELSPQGRRGGYGYTWANSWGVHTSQMMPKTLTIRRGSCVLNNKYGAAVR